MRRVLDTNVVVSALLWEGTPGHLLQAARLGRIELYTSVPLLRELAKVLDRPKFEAKIAASLLKVDELVDLYAVLASVVRPEETPRISADPDDDVAIGTAVAARADLMVSGDAHLLHLGVVQGIPIFTPAVAIGRIVTPETRLR